MKKSDLRYYRTIGKINSVISKANDYVDAVTGSLNVILESGIADYAVVWQADKEKEALHPVYWVCPLDLTSVSHPYGQGVVGKVYLSEENKLIDNISDMPDVQEDFAGLEISSLICLPLNNMDYTVGCIQFLRTKDRDIFTEDDVETCCMLTLMVQMQIEDKIPPVSLPEKKVLLSIQNLHKYYQSGEEMSHVLKGVNINVYKGEFLCLLGESGCGKSTVLNIIGGLLDFDEGNVNFDCREISGFSEKELTAYRRSNIGFIFQSYNLMPNLTAKQNLDIVGELSEAPADSQKLLELVGLGDKADRYPSLLSGGQQQRIAIARAMVKKPKLILADEPTAALDYATSIEVLSVMENVVKSGTTLIVVTHNVEIAKMADRVIRFRDGKTYEINVNTHPLHAKDLVW